MLDVGETLSSIASESDAAADTITPVTVDLAVPSCPDWSLADLIWHLGRVQRFWAGVVRAGDVVPEFPVHEPPPARADELEPWFRASTRELLDALREMPWDTPAWVWWKEGRTVGAIARHQVQEAAVHRWDAQRAIGAAAPLLEEIAADGVDEFLWLARQLRDPVSIALNASDSGQTYTIGPEPHAVTATAPASDLVLLLYGRVAADDVQVEGDRAALDAFLVPIG